MGSQEGPGIELLMVDLGAKVGIRMTMQSLRKSTAIMYVIKITLLEVEQY